MSKVKKPKNANKHRALSAQQTIPYIAMHPDGICQLPGGLYTKTLEYEDINYAVASTEDQSAIFSGWSGCLNYFDSSLPFQLSFINRRSRNVSRYKVNIPAQEDDFNSIRGEYVEMLKGQIAKSNNGIERYKYITFGLPAEGVAEARPRLGRVEADVMGNLKRLGDDGGILIVIGCFIVDQGVSVHCRSVVSMLAAVQTDRNLRTVGLLCLNHPRVSFHGESVLR